MEESDCLLVLYGHTARVWAARLLPNYIISIGEDATCRVWGYDGRTINVFKGHKGKSIWSVAVDRMNKIVVCLFLFFVFVFLVGTVSFCCGFNTDRLLAGVTVASGLTHWKTLLRLPLYVAEFLL